MSQENVEIARASIEAFNAEDWDRVFSDAAPDFELDWSRAAGPNRGGLRARSGSRGPG
jgi:hypothetical protein